MTLTFSGDLVYWKGPAPFYFIAVPEEPSKEIKAAEKMLTYGWGAIPTTVTVNGTEWYTALFPKDGRYLVPVKLVIRKKLKIEEGDHVEARLDFKMRDPEMAPWEAI